MSTHVASLERALGGTLVDRSHRPIGPTELGTAFLPHAREVLDALQRGADTVDRLTDAPRGTVVIGCHPSVSAGFLPGVLAAVHARHPLIRIELSERTTQDLVSGVLAGRFQIAIHSLAGDPPPPELHSVPLWSERFVAITPPDHPLRDARNPGTGDLPPAAIPEQPQTVVELARAGRGVGVLNGLAAAISATDGMAITPVGTLEQVRHVAVTRDRRTASSPSVEAVLAAILAAPVPAGVRRAA